MFYRASHIIQRNSCWPYSALVIRVETINLPTINPAAWYVAFRPYFTVGIKLSYRCRTEKAKKKIAEYGFRGSLFLFI